MHQFLNKAKYTIMAKFSHLIKLILLISTITALASCNGSGSNNSNNNDTPDTPSNPDNPNNPESVSVGFTSFTLQNFGAESSKNAPLNNAYAIKITIASESDNESNIYFSLPQDDLSNKMLNLTNLYPIINTADKESIYIAHANNTYTQIIPNSISNPGIDFTEANLHLIITTPNQAIAAGKIFTINLRKLESANISLTKIELKANPAGSNIADTLIDESTGIINSWITSNEAFESISLYPEFYFTGATDGSTPTALESNHAVIFTRISSNESSLITHYHITSKNDKVTAVYSNLLSVHPEDIHTGFTSFSLQNFAPESSNKVADANPYGAKIIIDSESDNESNIYFYLPKDALSTQMLKLTKLYPIINSPDKESIYIMEQGTYVQILPNSNTNQSVDFSNLANRQLIITAPNQAIESGKVFTIHLESVASANVTLQELKLESLVPANLNMALSTINPATGVITSLINFGQKLTDGLTLYPKFYFNQTDDDTTATANESGQGIQFATIAGNESRLIATYHVLSKDKKTTAIYTNLLGNMESSSTRIIDFSVESSYPLGFSIDQSNDMIIKIPYAENGDVTGALHLAYLGKSVTINGAKFEDGQVFTFSDTVPVTAEVKSYSNKIESYYIFTVREDATSAN